MASSEASSTHDVKSSTHDMKNLAREETDDDEMLLTRSSDIELGPNSSTNTEFGLRVQNNSIWYLDTGASNHMCGDESMFDDLSKIKAGHVSFEDDMFFSKEWTNWDNSGCVLRTRPQNQHIEYGAVNGKAVLSHHERSSAGVEG